MPRTSVAGLLPSEGSSDLRSGMWRQPDASAGYGPAFSVIACFLFAVRALLRVVSRQHGTKVCCSVPGSRVQRPCAMPVKTPRSTGVSEVRPQPTLEETRIANSPATEWRVEFFLLMARLKGAIWGFK
ncbi:hypothetical protein BDW62DRAFT_180467 [Aspergillus aurantiobrunneus]